jgi:hypothetical protein
VHQEVDLALEPGDLGFELDAALLDGRVPLSEAARSEFPGQVEAVDLLGFLGEARIFPPQPIEEVELGPEILVGFREGGPDRLR